MKRPPNYRPAIPMAARLGALFLQEGLSLDQAGMAVRIAERSRLLGAVLRSALAYRFSGTKAECDHDPALVLRAWNSRKGDTVPPANDPAYLRWRAKDEHAVKSFGPGGERRITTKGSDVALVHALRRIKETAEGHAAAMRAKRPGKGRRKPAGRWPSRKLPSRPMGGRA